MNTASSRWLVGIGAVVFALVVLAMVLGLIEDGAKRYSLDTPEGTVQQFLLALNDEDGQAAYNFLVPTVQDRCSYEDFRMMWLASPGAPLWTQVNRSRVTLDETRLFDLRAEVTVTISKFSEPEPLAPFENNERSFPLTFLLDSVDGQWRLSYVHGPVEWCHGPK